MFEFAFLYMPVDFKVSSLELGSLVSRELIGFVFTIFVRLFGFKLARELSLFSFLKVETKKNTLSNIDLALSI